MADDNAFEVSASAALASKLIHRYKGLWLNVGNLETRLLDERLKGVSIDRPVFVAGLARSGTTILLELISSIAGVTTHRYRDFPLIFAPWIWNWFVDRAQTGTPEPVERAHADRIQITPESPEAMEEPLWMAFFDNLHNSRQSNVLGHDVSNPAFEMFYRDHIRKLLLLRQGDRYASKGNYNVSRMRYLLKQFPDARFVIPVRDPQTHIASLLKQHKLFEAKTRDNPRALAHLRQVGHFEFGPIRSPINTGDDATVEQVRALWESGEEVAGWARYWNLIYDFVAASLEEDAALREATLVVHFEEFCASPEVFIRRILQHCELGCNDDLIRDFASRISLPTYYKWPFSKAEQTLIDEETVSARSRMLNDRVPMAG